jgi:hypothetical protein
MDRAISGFPISRFAGLPFSAFSVSAFPDFLLPHLPFHLPFCRLIQPDALSLKFSALRRPIPRFLDLPLSRFSARFHLYSPVGIGGLNSIIVAWVNHYRVSTPNFHCLE